MIQSVLTILYFALAIFLHIFGFSLIKKPLALPFISLLLYQRAVTQFASLRNKLLVQFSLCQVRAHKMFLNLPIIWICWLFWLCYCKWSVWSLFSCSFILFFFFSSFAFEFLGEMGWGEEMRNMERLLISITGLIKSHGVINILLTSFILLPLFIWQII